MWANLQAQTHINMPLMTDQCPKCFSFPPVCTKGRTATDVCGRYHKDPAAARNANGTYDPDFLNNIPIEVRAVPSSFLDTLTNYQIAAPGGYTAGSPEANIEAAPGTVSLTTLSRGVTVAIDRPGLRREIKDAMRALLDAGTNGPETARIQVALGEINQAEMVETQSRKPPESTSSTHHLENTYPISTLFQTITKNVERGTEVKPDASEMLDTVTGKRYIPFAKATKASCASKFMYALMVFVDTMGSVQGHAPSVWREFSRRCMLLESSDGFLMAQEFVDASLRCLDEKRFTSIVDLFARGEHNQIIGDLRSLRVAPVPDLHKDPRLDKNSPKFDPRTKINFGPVTKPLGGDGAGICTNFKTKVQIKCNRFHATPQKACTAGVPKEAQYDQSKWGLCAYLH